jgi:glycosyltransferase involved in cell wall biosynthesis
MKLAIVVPWRKVLSEKYYNVQEYGLAKNLVRIGVDVDIYVTGQSAGKSIEKRKVDGKRHFRIIRLPARQFARQSILIGLEREIQNSNYDLVQVAEDYQFTTFQMARLCRKRKIPLIIVQGFYGRHKKAMAHLLHSLFDRVLGRYIRHNTSHVICKTTSAEASMRAKGYTALTTIPVGLDIETLSVVESGQSFREEIGVSQNTPLLLYIGTIEPRRNLSLALETVARIKDHLPDIRFAIIGDGPDRESIVTQTHEMQLSDNVLFLGKIPNKDLGKAYSAADLFLLPSKYEIFGMVVLESMAFGTPVLSTPSAGPRDIIHSGVNGFLVPFDAGRIADVALELFGDRVTLAQIGQKAQTHVRQNYAWSKIAPGYSKVYSDTIAQWKTAV